MAHAIDREALKSALFDFPIISGSYIPTELEVYDPEAGLPFDLEVARDELSQSAYPDGFEVEVLIDAGSPQENTLAQVVQDQLGKIGVTLNIKRLDLGARIEALVSSDYKMIFQDINQVTADPAEMTAWAVEPSFGAFFFTGYEDDDLAQLARDAGREPDPARRAELYSQVQRQTAEAAYIIVPYNLPNIWSSTDKLRNVELGLADAIDFTDAYLVQ
jgi:peptide/nickel transport system substrate-binding protein